MLTETQVAQVRRLLAAGLTRTEVRWRTGVSRSTVARIARGKRPDYEAVRRAKAELDALWPTGPARRCSGCGCKVATPCLICRARQARWRSGRLPNPERQAVDVIVGLDLLPEHRRRYDELRAQRLLRASEGFSLPQPRPANAARGRRGPK